MLVEREEMTDDGWRKRVRAEGGMSLRDHFAGLALNGQIKVVQDEGGIWNPKAAAALAYEFADAMIAERAK